MSEIIKEPTGLIFDVQAFSVHDGPGCRTNVFFVGCPLTCQWCANPESWGNKKHVMFAQASCKWEKGCRACENSCPYGGLKFHDDRLPSIDWNICKDCKTFECTKICSNKALKMCGQEYSVDELVRILRRDFSNWGLDGGVTFSGGEPLLHHEFLDLVLQRCHQLQIHTAIETCAHVKNEIFWKIFRNIDFAFIDVKNMDREKHKSGTGVYNDMILDNIASLKKHGWGGRLILRQPTIGGYNDSFENAKAVIEFMKENDLFEINLLKFHRLGATKWTQMGMQYPYETTGDVELEHLQELQKLYLDNDIACYVADDTPF